MTPEQTRAIRNLKAGAIANNLKQLDTLMNELRDLEGTEDIIKKVNKLISLTNYVYAAYLLDQFVEDNQNS